MEIKLHVPFQKDGKTIDKINLNLQALKGRDLIKAEQEARAMGNTTLNPLYSMEGQAIVAAKASGLVPDDIFDLSGPDFVEITSQVNVFLNGWVLPESTPLETSGKPS